MTSNFHTSSKPLKEIDIRLPENTVKGAVKLDPDIGKYADVTFGVEEISVPWTLVIFDKENEVLSDFITRLGNQWKLPHPDSDIYALRFESGENEGAFLTDDNRSQIKQGFMLIFTASPERYSNYFLSRLVPGTQANELRVTLNELTAICSDYAFAFQFHRASGLARIVEMIEKGQYSDDLMVLSQMLQALLMLMEHTGLMQWAEVSDKLIKKVAENITGRAKQEDNTLLLSSLNIIDLILNSRSEEKMNLVMDEVPFESLIRHLEKSDERVLCNVLTLMNSLYAKANEAGRAAIVEHLHATPFRNAIENSVLRKNRQLDVGIETQLVTVQRILLNELAVKAKRAPSEADIERVMQLKAFSADACRQLHSGDARRLEWKQFADAISQTPPGLLAVELISQFAIHHPDSIAKISVENSLRVDGNAWPVPVVCVDLVLILIDIIHVMNEPEDGDRLLVILFKSERPFLDLFAVLVRLFDSTWREMHASEEDIKKVLAVVRKQMDTCLLERPTTIERLDELLATHSYPYMQKIWERERKSKETEELQSDSVRELRDFLRPSIEDLVKRNRKNALKNGFTFGKLSKSKSLQKGQQFWHWKLDPNEKTFLCTECATADNTSSADPVTTKVAVSDVQRVIIGGELDGPLSSSSKGKKNLGVRGLTIEVGETPDVYHLITSDENAINTWFDGINALIGSEKLSTHAQRQVDRFLKIELKMRLLHLDHVPNSFDVPPLPDSMDWIPDDVISD